MTGEAPQTEFAGSPLRDRVIFLVGARRSGTNWLQRMLAVHPEIASVPSETCLFSHGIAPLRERFHHGPTDSTTTGAMYMDPGQLRTSLRRLCDDVLIEQARRLEPGASRVLERTPMHVHHLDLISELYPDAFVIHIIRDGCDVAASLSRQGWGPATIGEAAREWASAIRDARSVAVPRYREVRYETLLEGPVEGVRELWRWLDLPVDDAALAKIDRAARQLFNVTRGHPGVRAGKWRHSFTAEQAAAVNREAGEMLSQLGYPPAQAAAAPPGPKRASPPWLPRVTQDRARALGARVGEAGRGAGSAVRIKLLERLGWHRPEPEPPPRHFEIVTSQLYMTSVGQLVDHFVEAVALHRYERLSEMVAPDLQVLVGDRCGRRSASDAAALDLLIAALRGDEARRGQLVRDDTLKHALGATIVQTHAATDGALSETTYVLEARWAGRRAVISRVLAHLGTGR